MSSSTSKLIIGIAGLVLGGLAKQFLIPTTDVKEVIKEIHTTDTAYVQIIRSIPTIDTRTIWDTVIVGDTVFVTRIDSVKIYAIEDWTWTAKTPYDWLTLRGTASFPSHLVTATPILNKTVYTEKDKFYLSLNLPILQSPSIALDWNIKTNKWIGIGISPKIEQENLKARIHLRAGLTF